MDVKQISLILSDPNVVTYYGIDSPVSIERARDIVEKRRDRFESGDAIRWALARKVDNLYIGSVGIRHTDAKAGIIEIGYELSSDQWGQGLMTEAIAGVVSYIFRRTKVFRIEALVETGNDRSMALLERLGFVREGLLRKVGCWRGERHDLVMFSFLKSDIKGQIDG